MNLIWIAAGAAVGGVMRYLVGGWVQDAAGGAFPAGTLAVNIIGCLLIGIIAQLAESTGLVPPHLRLLLITGFLGGFTTYSTFANEAFLLGRVGEQAMAFAYVALHLLLGLGAVWLGRLLVAAIWRAA
ncbi:MAG: fluoride efflux transporter CrcB [Caldilineaceae bacterium]